VRIQIEKIHSIPWDNYPIKSIYKSKLVPPILPARTQDMDHFRSLVKQYLCTNCCSHRVIRTPRTAPGCVDVMDTYQGLRNEDVVVPPKDNHDKFFQLQSFVCGCKRKALICETDKLSDFRYTKDHRALDPRLPETELSEECIIACNLRIL